MEKDRWRSADLNTEMQEDQTRNYQTAAAELEQKIQQKEDIMRGLYGDTDKLQKEVSGLRDSAHQASEKLAELRATQQKLTGQKSSLEALQHEDLKDQQEVQEWLSAKGLENAPRLIQQIDVEPEWAFALETVLGHHLQDICVDHIADPQSYLSGLGQGRIGLITSAKQNNSAGKYQKLLEKVRSELVLDDLLFGVYIADDLAAASQMRNDLASHESVITPDGTWMGAQWLRVHRQAEGYTDAITREQQIHDIEKQEEDVLASIAVQQQQNDNCRQRLQEAEQELQSAQRIQVEEQGALAQLQSQHAEYRTRHEQLSERLVKINEELEELELNRGDDESELESIRHNLQKTRQDREELDGQRARLMEIRESHRGSLDTARGQWQSTHEQSHEIALQLESISSQRASLEQAIKRSAIQLSNQQARSREIQELIKTSEEPLSSLQQDLEKKLGEKVTAENVLAEKRTEMQSKDSDLRKTEQRRVDGEQEVQDRREQLATAKMNAQETQVRLQTVSEQLKEQGYNITEMLEQMTEEAEKSAWQERLESVERKINRLGPINLAAIDEYEQLSERKEYLDKQDEDLNEALQTLETAIRKIDKETRTRFKETFDFLNTNLKEMFPILFGGGHAYLELTGDDLLETGVSIMARPPGKRNSTIHLLSGGEKALTAVALVFAIFKLNPAPFCILDEVDAPLDDSNTARFSELLKQMSDEVQFIFITHNKITMEIARQLLGVTMYEPGVSRLVSVDVDEAVEMAVSA